jgi:hypothetical protein
VLNCSRLAILRYIISTSDQETPTVFKCKGCDSQILGPRMREEMRKKQKIRSKKWAEIGSMIDLFVAPLELQLYYTRMYCSIDYLHPVIFIQ